MNKKKIFAFAVGPFLAAAFAFFTLPLIAWMYTPEDVGRMNILQTFIAFSLLLFVLGLDQAYVREFHESKNRSRLLKTCMLPGFLLLILAMVFSLPFGAEISELLYGANNPEWYWLSLGCVIFVYISRFFALVIRMQERGVAYSFSQVVPKILVLAVFLIYIVTDAPRDYRHLIISQIVSFAFVFAICTWNVRSELASTMSISISRIELERLLKFGAPLIGAGMASWGLSATSTIMLRTFSELRELGIYSMATNFAGVAIIFQTIFSTIWMPTVYKWTANGGEPTKIEEIRGYVLIIVCFILGLTGMFSWVIDYILPPDYSSVKHIVACCMFQPLLYVLSETTVVGVNIQRKSNHALAVAVIALVANLIFSYLLVEKYGATGAAIANSLAFTVFFVARTEASIMVWKLIPRFKIYLMVLALQTLVIINAFGEWLYGNVIYFIWALFLILFSYFERKEISIMFSKMRT